MNQRTSNLKRLPGMMLLVVTMLLLSFQTARADVTLKVYTDGVESDEGGTIALNGTSNVIVTPNTGYHIDKVEHMYNSGSDTNTQSLSSDGMGGYYFYSSNGGTVSAYFMKNFFVYFNANGGAGTMAKVLANPSYTIPACGFTRENITFIGWATSAEGDVVYMPDDKITLTSDLTLYAKWDANFTVTFHSNGGVGTMDAVRPDYESYYTIPACGFTKDGYGFIGWATSAEGDVVYKPNQRVLLTADLTLYAKWKVNRTVFFHANGGTGTMESFTQVDGTKYSLPECSFTKDGYTFIGWATSAGGAVEYNSGISITLTADMTLYAIWADNSGNYIVLFDAHNGAGLMEAVQQENTSFTIPACGFSRENYIFYGWSTSAGGSVKYEPGETITLTDNLTLYAKWITNRGTFDVDGLRYTVTDVNSKAIGVYRYVGDKPTGDLIIPATVTIAGTEFSVTSIEDNVFSRCENLTTVHIPDGVTSIGRSAFYNCSELTTVNIPDGVTSIGEYAFYNCSELTTVNIPDGVTSIGDYTFYRCSRLTTVNIPDGVTSIGEYAFIACDMLSVNIPATVTSIGSHAFYNCNLGEVTIPSGLTRIGESAFRGCQLSTVTIYALSLTEYGVDAFDTYIEKIYVPAVSVDTYKAAWSEYADKIEPLEVMIIGDGDDISVLTPVNGQTENVILTRTFPAGKKQTVCLPFDPSPLLKFGKVWQFTGISQGKAVMTEITGPATLHANTPYIFQANSDVTSITFPNVEVSIGSDPRTEGSGFSFHGTYSEKIWEQTSDEVQNGTIYGFMATDNDGQAMGQFVKARRRTVLRPFSCWLEYNGELTDTDPSSSAPLRAGTRAGAVELPDVIEIVWMSGDGIQGTTGMMDTRTGEIYEDDSWYGIDGGKLNGKPVRTGLYINKGKRVYITVE